MEIRKIETLTINKVYNILSATHISASQKEDFLRVNSVEINALFSDKINTESFRKIMKNRPLKLFRPFKNSYTKAGDKKILAETLGIPLSEVNDYITNLSEIIKSGDFKKLQNTQPELIKSYVYRHGKIDEVINFLDYELSTAKDTLEVLYNTLSYNTGGAADYFVRPIHRLNNKTLICLYDIIDKNLKTAKTMGDISEESREQTAQWALVRIYEIQNNQKLKNALKLKRILG